MVYSPSEFALSRNLSPEESHIQTLGSKRLSSFLSVHVNQSFSIKSLSQPVLIHDSLKSEITGWCLCGYKCNQQNRGKDKPIAKKARALSRIAASLLSSSDL